jgi:putative acetyltransferase
LLTIRPETPADREAIARVETAAFRRDDEARLVNALRDAGKLVLSLVADEDGEIVGHIAFSPLRFEPAEPSVSAVALGPVAVMPGRMRHGIGGRLIEKGLGELTALQVECVIVLGEPDFFSWFGFVPASSMGLLRPEDPPEHVSRFLQVVELVPYALGNVKRRAFYADEFNPGQ